MITKQTKQMILERGFYDYIATYYHEHTKEDLATLAKEYCYAVHENNQDIDRKACENMWEEIELEEAE